MKLRFSLRLQVCLYSVLSLGADSRLSAAAVAAADVPTSVRVSDEIGRKLDSSTVVQTDIAILERARAANQDVYASLQSFVCNEEIIRFRGNLNGQSKKSLDTVKAKLSFERGVENYTQVFQNKHQRAGITSLTGAWSEGEFGTLLLQTQQLLETQKVNFQSFADVKGEQAAIYSFDVAAEDSPWDLAVGPHHYRLAFKTNVWISAKTGEILKINRTSLSIAAETHISEIQWGITLERVALNGSIWLLPTNGTYAVLYNESHRREWNLISFTDYQRYGAQTALRFD